MKVNLQEEFKKDSWIVEVMNSYLDKERECPKTFPLHSLRECLESYNWSPPRMVEIPKSDGKSMREIYIYNEYDSFLLKILNNIISSKLGNLICDNVYSYQKGKRTYNAVSYIKEHLRNNTNLVGVKLDISNYFLSVNREAITRAIDNLVEDESGKILLRNLFSLDKCINSIGEIEEKYLGIAPGSALSSYMANYILKPLDDFMQENEIVYARYSDDLVIFSESDETLDSIIKQTKSIIASLGLEIKDSKVSFFKNNETIDFLGLKIINNSIIDVSDRTIKNIKQAIRKKSYKYKEKAYLNKDEISNCIRSLNKALYGNVLNPSYDHKGGRMNYVFSNVTTDKTIKLLDYYILDTLNFIYTGAHNKNTKRLTTKEFEDLGFKSCVQLYNLYKLDKDLYSNEIYRLTQNREVYKPFTFLSSVDPKQKYIDLDFSGRSFSSLFYEVLDRGFFIIDNKEVYAEYLIVDIEKKEIRCNDLVIIKNNSVVIDSIDCCIDNVYYRVDLSKSIVSDLVDNRSTENLMRCYIGYSYKTDLSLDVYRKPFNGYYVYNGFLRFNVNSLLANYTEEYLRLDKSYSYRQCLFLSYLLFHLVSNQLWEGLNYSHNLIKCSDEFTTLVIPKDLLEIK